MWSGLISLSGFDVIVAVKFFDSPAFKAGRMNVSSRAILFGGGDFTPANMLGAVTRPITVLPASSSTVALRASFIESTKEVRNSTFMGVFIRSRFPASTENLIA